MSDLRILVVENTVTWQEELRATLDRLGTGVQVSVASDYESAVRLATNETYDLAVLDLALLVEPNDPLFSDELGMTLLRQIRFSEHNQSCGLIILSGFATKARTRVAFRDYAADDVIDKVDFDNDAFLEIARQVILGARLRRAAARTRDLFHLTIRFSQDHLLGSELTAPGRRTAYSAEHATHFNANDLARRADNLNLLVLKGGIEAWRPEARSLGSTVYDTLATDPHILGDLTAARALVPRSGDLWIEFSGPPVGLGIPFELLRDADEYLALNHILTRRVQRPGSGYSRKSQPLHEFVQTLRAKQQPIRILIVGSNSDGMIPTAEIEASSLSTMIESDLHRLGLDSEITVLVGPDASYANVKEALSGRDYHIFHYAGHGRFEDRMPEISGLVLRDGTGFRTLTAGDLSLILRDTKLHLIFLSCCLGARTASQTGRGDFYGLLDALSHADVPIVMGYRWVVADVSAKLLAQSFYQELWRTFSPGQALLEARRNSAMVRRGLDNETWASPVLLMQNV